MTSTLGVKFCPKYPALGTGKGRISPIELTDDGFHVDDFVVPKYYRNSLSKILLPHGLVVDRIEKLAWDILMDYEPNDGLHLLCILKGSRRFFNQLTHYLYKINTFRFSSGTRPPYFEHYVRLKSYADDKSSGKLEIIADNMSCLRGEHVLIVEDIIDTGTTLEKFSKWLSDYEPKSLKVASLLEKRYFET